mmetsp:Transcript_4377/g.6173  ORF Transcript_4377/g.6173 Transcript_4377/m.6173 type:complete len:222 (-) Transcript_4377:542-1207(-)
MGVVEASILYLGIDVQHVDIGQNIVRVLFPIYLLDSKDLLLVWDQDQDQVPDQALDRCLYQCHRCILHPWMICMPPHLLHQMSWNLMIMAITVDPLIKNPTLGVVDIAAEVGGNLSVEVHLIVTEVAEVTPVMIGIMTETIAAERGIEVTAVVSLEVTVVAVIEEGIGKEIGTEAEIVIEIEIDVIESVGGILIVIMKEDAVEDEAEDQVAGATGHVTAGV